MTEQLFKDVYDEGLAKDAIINDRHTGHKEDYLLLHVLLKRYQPKKFCELGTNTGFGTKIIKNALGADSEVFTIDLPSDQADISEQHPISEGKGDCVGFECEDIEHVQILADTRTFNYAKYGFDGFFVDAEHTYISVFFETRAILLCNPKIIIWHDADVSEVFNAIFNAMYNRSYKLYRITDSRIAYALKKEL